MRILMIGSALTINGGIQRYILNLLGSMDLARYEVDLLATPVPDGVPSCEAELRRTGIKHIYYMPGNDKQRLFFYPRFFREHSGYDIIHFHTTSKINALACGIIRHACPDARLIVHSHTVYPPMTLSWKIAHRFYQHWADYFLGCSVAAGRFVFGPDIDKKPNFAVACNAVDKARFHPDDAARADIRARYGVADDQRLAGFVGRYSHEKKPAVSAGCFRGHARRGPVLEADAGWAGQRTARQSDAKIQALGLTGAVIQTGVQENVPLLYELLRPCFSLPSRGLTGSPVTLVEAQGCGVPCLASTNVPPDSAVTGLVQFLPLDAPFSLWAQKAQAAGRGPHQSHWDTLAAASYELGTAARQMEPAVRPSGPRRKGGRPMIYAELAGGLGNQMFLYAFARALALRTGEEVTLLDRQDWKSGAPAHTHCALNALRISPQVHIRADAAFAKHHLPLQNTLKSPDDPPGTERRHDGPELETL